MNRARMARPKNDDGIDSLGVTAANYAADDMAAVIALYGPQTEKGLARLLQRPVEYVRRILKDNRDRFAVTEQGVAVKRYKP